jgi:hypothetical protein
MFGKEIIVYMQCTERDRMEDQVEKTENEKKITAHGND